MCRIAGFWHFNFRGDYSLEVVGLSMRDTLSYGGPDDAGVYIEPSEGLVITHRRLSILDLSSAGHQPMEFDNLVIVYNGEVYNFRQIRSELEKEGYDFLSNSDTEVILKSFHRWGVEAVNRFRGMFAFALWDKNQKRLILFRDRVGVKPLYYYYKNGFFAFSSELKALHNHPKFKKEIEPLALALFLQYGYITAPLSIFKHTYKLEPGHYMIVERNGTIKKEKYWDIGDFFRQEPIETNEDEISKELEELLIESFKLRMVSDVPVGLFLSGGVDSSTVCALLQREMSVPLKTFTIGFHEREYNEAEYAKNIAQHLGTDHTELYCTQSEAFEIIPKLPEIYDEPFGDSSAIPTYLVSKLAKQKVKVSLSADGGDEQFFGYTRYWIVGESLKKLNSLPFLGFISKILDIIHPDIAISLYNLFRPLLPEWNNFRDKYVKLRNVLKSKELKIQYDLSNKIFLPRELSGLSKVLENINISQLSQIDTTRLRCNEDFMMLYDFKTYLPDDILVKVDRATMSVSLEGREPLLDHKLLEYTARLPIIFKYRNKRSKYILRKILYKYIPQALIDRPKMGFGVPIYEWFKADLKELYMHYLNIERIEKEDFLNAKEVERLLNDYLEGRGINHNKLWFLFIFELWRERWM